MITTCVKCKIPAEVLYAAGSCEHENTKTCPVFDELPRADRRRLIVLYRQEVWYPEDYRELNHELDEIYSNQSERKEG